MVNDPVNQALISWGRGGSFGGVPLDSHDCMLRQARGNYTVKTIYLLALLPYNSTIHLGQHTFPPMDLSWGAELLAKKKAFECHEQVFFPPKKSLAIFRSFPGRPPDILPAHHRILGWIDGSLGIFSMVFPQCFYWRSF